METTIKIKQNSKGLALLVLSSVFCCLGIICLILHVSPSAIFNFLTDFASHHYFLFGFFCLLIAIVCLKFYSLSNEEYNAFLSSGINKTKHRRLGIARLKSRIGLKESKNRSVYICKEKVTSIKFRIEDLLVSQQDRKNRFEALQKAMSLGNLYKQKAVICFKADDVINHTCGTVWHADEYHVSLKGGAIIPVNRIFKIEI